MLRIYSLMSLLCVWLLSACAAAPSSSEAAFGQSTDCIFARSITDWRPLDDGNLILFAGRQRPYHVELTRRAFDLTRDDDIGLYDRDGRICPYGGDAVVVNGAIPERVTIASIRALDEGELQALYESYGIRPPVIIEATEIESEESETAD
jgi:hypothetical protein